MYVRACMFGLRVCLPMRVHACIHMHRHTLIAYAAAVCLKGAPYDETPQLQQVAGFGWRTTRFRQAKSVHAELPFHSLALLCFVAGPTMLSGKSKN